MDALKLIAQDSVKTEIPQFEVGDTIRIDVNIREGDRERIQVFEGTVIVRKGRVRRAKLYFLRDRVGKAAKVKEQIR